MRSVLVGAGGLVALVFGATVMSSLSSGDRGTDVVTPWRESQRARAERVAEGAKHIGIEIATYYVDNDSLLQVVGRPGGGVTLTDGRRDGVWGPWTRDVALDPDLRLLAESTHATGSQDWCVTLVSAGHPESAQHYAEDHGPGAGPCPSRS